MSNEVADTPESLREDISDHLDKLQNTFKKQFPPGGLQSKTVLTKGIPILFLFNGRGREVNSGSAGFES